MSTQIRIGKNILTQIFSSIVSAAWTSGTAACVVDAAVSASEATLQRANYSALRIDTTGCDTFTVLIRL